MKKLLYITVYLSFFAFGLQSQWIKQTIPVNKNITGIKFIDSLRGWACTDWTPAFDTGYIFNTTNGGANWNIQYKGAVSFFCITMIDANTGYCGGSSGPGRLFKTTNGGLNWNEIGTPTRVFDMFFLNADSGWICSETFAADVRTTTDGGQTWTLRNNNLNQTCHRLYFLNYSTGWVAANTTLFKTTNAGINWVIYYDVATAGIRSIYFKDETTGWLGLTNQKISSTTNGGNNWTMYTFSTLFGNFTDIAYFPNKIYFGNRTIRLLITTNNGTEWVYQVDSVASYRLSFIDSQKGWSGDFGIAKTTNGGGPVTYIGVSNLNEQTPASYSLSQNYPNPFNPATNIKFTIPGYSFVSLIIYDALGKSIGTEVDGFLKAGSYIVHFDGSKFTSGIYFYKLTAGGYSETKKMIILK